jgi:thymidylate synthase (FAD)
MSVTLLRHVGTDLDVVNNAKVSFDNESQWDDLTAGLKRADIGLIQFLARGCSSGDWTELKETLDRTMQFGTEAQEDACLMHLRNMPTHWAPFANGVGATFRIKAPIPIMRQLFKHEVGSVKSEISRRYVKGDVEFFCPKWRKAAPNVKQGSSKDLHDMQSFVDPVSGMHVDMGLWYERYLEQGHNLYNLMIAEGVCPEQARFVLPQAMMTEAVITHSLYGWANVFNQRHDRNHAQQEIADIADMIADQMKPLFPESWPALTGCPGSV